MSITQFVHEQMERKVTQAEQRWNQTRIFDEWDVFYYQEVRDSVQELLDHCGEDDPMLQAFIDLHELAETVAEMVEALEGADEDIQAGYWYLFDQMNYNDKSHEYIMEHVAKVTVMNQTPADWAEQYITAVYGDEPFKCLGNNIDWAGVYDDIRVDGNVDAFEYAGQDFIIYGLQEV